MPEFVYLMLQVEERHGEAGRDELIIGRGGGE